MNRAIFLDRDGVLNNVIPRGSSVTAPWKLSEFKIKDDASSFVDAVKALGFKAIVATNQPDVSKGILPLAELEEIHRLLSEHIAIDWIEACTSADDNDARRKPNPGMLLDASKKFDIDLQQSFFIGDTIKDVLAGKKAGVKTILIETEYNLEARSSADFCCKSLHDALQIIQSNFTVRFLQQTQTIANALDVGSIEKMVHILNSMRSQGGRLFLVGSGGGAGHASHAVCDFRKICGIEAYCPSDNVSELTARINDEGWDTCIANSLRSSRLCSQDCVFVFSVGGGNAEKNISNNLVNAVKLAKEVGAKVIGVVGRDGGYTAQHSDACVVVPTVDSGLVTPHTEAFQAVVWHLLVSHPGLALNQTKWESTK